MKRNDLTGQRFGKLVALESRSEQRGGKRRVVWKCLCDCGNITYVVSDNLRSGQTRSCGCSKGEYISQSKKRKNRYKICGDYTIIYTNKGKEIIVDTEDLERLLKICWVERNDRYICGKNMETGKLVLIHRYILNLGNCNDPVDHINRNGFDNRKCNLRLCTPSQNGMNRTVSKRSTTGVTGVYYIKERNKWLARIEEHHDLHELGCFESFDEAVNARKNAEKKYFGEYAPL